EPFTLACRSEADEADHVLADQHLGQDLGKFPRRGQMRQCLGRAEAVIADAIDVDDDPIRTIGIDAAFELADHGANPSASCLGAQLEHGKNGPAFWPGSVRPGDEHGKWRWRARRRHRLIWAGPGARAPSPYGGSAPSPHALPPLPSSSPDWAHIRRR